MSWKLLSVIKDLKSAPFLMSVLLSITFFSGYLFIFIFENDLFLKLDSIKLSLLAASIVAPSIFAFFLIDSIYIFRNGFEIAEDEDWKFLFMFGGCFNTPLIIYLLTLIRCFFVYSTKIALMVFVIIVVTHLILELINKKMGYRD